MYLFLRSDLARQYRSKMSEIELQRSEQARLTAEYEAKLRKKEVNMCVTRVQSEDNSSAQLYDEDAHLFFAFKG